MTESGNQPGAPRTGDATPAPAPPAPQASPAPGRGGPAPRTAPQRGTVPRGARGGSGRGSVPPVPGLPPLAPGPSAPDTLLEPAPVPESAAAAAGGPAPRPPARPAEPAPDLAGWIAGWQPEDAPLLAARQRAREVGVPAVDEATGATLRMLAALAGARHVVELGTGTGVSTLWLLRGLQPDGVLTSIDAEPEHQRLARLSLTEAGARPSRVRLIAGRALDVLPRLSDSAYDLVLCDASSAEAVDYLPAALRILRTGGVVVFAGALAGGRVADPSARDPDAVAARELARVVREEPGLVPALVPVGAGLLVAVKVDAPQV